MRRFITPFLLAAAITQTAFAQTPGPAPIGEARDLYASARYDEALAVLNDLSAAGGGAASRKSIEQYRSLCLLALGRDTEAEAAIAAVVAADPTYLPGEAEASPRVRAAFSEVRRRALPDIATARYADAKAAFDRKDYPAAVQQFGRLIALLDDPDMGGRLPDMRTLAAGFLDLATAAATPPPAPAPAPPPPPPPAPKPDPNRIYTIEDKNVTPPVAIRQEIPRLTGPMRAQARDRGVIEVVIDEQGRVMNIAVRESVQPLYDAEVLAKGREWKYEPAVVDGRPVRFRKLIQLNITRDR